MAHLASVSTNAILNSVAPRTLSSYYSAWKCFKEFHSIHSISFPTLDVLTLSSFIAYLHKVRRIRAGSIQTYLSGINFFHKLALGAPCPALEHAHITMIIKGLRKSEPKIAPTRQALTADLLRKCIQTLRAGYNSIQTDLCLEAMILLGFFAFLRCAESTSRLGFFDPKIHPTISDIIFCSADTLIFNLKISKTNQSGPAQRILIFKLDSDLSPYESIHRHVRHRLAANAGPSDPLFVTVLNTKLLNMCTRPRS